MRLKPEKIDHLSKIILQALDANSELALGDDRNAILALIRTVITNDLKAEDDIEEEARRTLEKHMNEIQRSGASYEKLLLKAKQQLARERKMVL